MKRSLLLIAFGLSACGFAQTPPFLFTEGHGDIGIGHSGSAWDMHIHSDEWGETEADEQIIVAPLTSLFARPASSNFDFIGVGSGQQFFRLRESSTAGQPFLGISTEEFDGPSVSFTETDSRLARISGTMTDAWVSLDLVSVVAPAGGQFSLYSNDPDGNGPVVWMATTDGVSSNDRFILNSDSHAHANWAFTTAGQYDITFRARYWDGTGFVNSPDTTYTFQAVPEPASMAAIGLGVVALLRKRKNNK